MKVSVVIPNYNGYKFIERCLGSLYQQTFKDFEVIFVDNASSDGSCAWVEENYPAIKVIKLDDNYGFSKAVNAGIRASGGEFVVLLNNDTEADASWLENLVNCIAADAGIFSCCSKMLQFNDRNRIDDAGDGYNILGWAYKRGDGARAGRYSRDEEVFSSCAGAAIYRRQLFEVIGEFDENFFAYMEDVDLSWRARLCGYKNIYCSAALIYHVGSGTSGSKYNAFKVKLSARNNLYVLLKNMPLLQMAINLPFLIIGFFIKFLFFAQKGFGREFISGFMEAISGRRRLKKNGFKAKYLKNYLMIEYLLIKDTFEYLGQKLEVRS